jgi:hypothetical protein
LLDAAHANTSWPPLFGGYSQPSFFKREQSKMSKSISRGASSALAMARDAFGNLITGNDERALRFIAEQVKLLEAVVALSESKNGVKENAALEALLRSQVTMEDEWPKFSGEHLQEHMKKWSDKGITSDMGLVAADPELLRGATKVPA